MRYNLSRQTEEDGEFYKWGTYDVSNENELTALMHAAIYLNDCGAHAIKVEKANEGLDEYGLYECPQCNGIVTERQRFCHYCGRRLRQEGENNSKRLNSEKRMELPGNAK